MGQLVLAPGLLRPSDGLSRDCDGLLPSAFQQPAKTEGILRDRVCGVDRQSLLVFTGGFREHSQMQEQVSLPVVRLVQARTCSRGAPELAHRGRLVKAELRTPQQPPLEIP